jgi:hypothetical protein
LKYRILDPLLCALALEVEDNVLDSLLHPPSLVLTLSHTDTTELFNNARISVPQKKIEELQVKLKNLGCVDLFGVCEKNGKLRTPSLSALLNNFRGHSEKNQNIVITDLESKTQVPPNYCALYLPNPEMKLIQVTKAAYDSLCVIFNLIDRQLLTMKIGNTAPSWLRGIEESPCCPCKFEALPSTEVEKEAEKEVEKYYVTSPLNFRSSQHYPVYLSPGDKIKVTSGYLIKSPAPPDSGYYIRVLSWMSRQIKVPCCIRYMTNMYIYLCDTKTPIEPEDLRDLTDLLRNDKKLLWIPDRNLELNSILQWGVMLSLSCVVRTWPDDKIYNDIPSCPVKALTDCYRDQDVQFLFSRAAGLNAVVCSACQIVEGTFGPRGCPWYGAMRGAHRCLCDDRGFGRCDACMKCNTLYYMYYALYVLCIVSITHYMYYAL